MDKGLNTGDWIWCFICGTESIVSWIRAYQMGNRWKGAGFEDYAVCKACEEAGRHSRSIGKIEKPDYDKEVTIP